MPLYTPSPAPWRAAEHGSGAAIVDANGYRIASLRYQGNSVSMKVSADQCWANHRLMIAAPDLLHALRTLYSKTNCQDQATIDLVCAALQRATYGDNL